MAYRELIKNFERVRAYMREFYVYGFKSRGEYIAKSARSYDDERRHIESWLGDYMRFIRDDDGKNVFLSVDSRAVRHNPFYKAWKSRSFTDGDITLHFILFDILHTPEVELTLSELVEEIDRRLESFEPPMTPDESTVRKKLKEYTAEGIIKVKKEGRHVIYSRASSVDVAPLSDALDFFSEVLPCGEIGSFILDKLPARDSIFSFKHHYITGSLDSDVMASLFDAMRDKSFIRALYHKKKTAEAHEVALVPMRIYISSGNGKSNLIAFDYRSRTYCSFRLERLSNVKKTEVCTEFDALRQKLSRFESHAWGVNFMPELTATEHVEFELYVEDGEEYIIRRLEREKRCGKVERMGPHIYRYTAEVFDTSELIPWIRTFICRITRMNFSNRTAENVFKEDLKQMYCLYGVEEAYDDIQ